LDNGVGLLGVTALVVAWVTVGLTHLPMEASVLGWRFAAVRNLFAFVSAILIAFAIAGLAGGSG
ncbi:MAG: permease, partial [Pseudomonadota bacterium]|nr:permease [Pseudomonadota bacterium]